MYFIDVQGTLISDSDKSPIRGSIEFIQMCNDENIPYMVVTNNTKKASNDFYGYLNSIGFDFNRLLTCAFSKGNTGLYVAPLFSAVKSKPGIRC